MPIYKRTKKDGKVTKTFTNPITGKTRTIIKYKDEEGKKHKKVSVRTKEGKELKDKVKDDGYKQFSKERLFKSGKRKGERKSWKYREKGAVTKTTNYRDPEAKYFKKVKDRRGIFGPGIQSAQTWLTDKGLRKSGREGHRYRRTPEYKEELKEMFRESTGFPEKELEKYVSGFYNPKLKRNIFSVKKKYTKEGKLKRKRKGDRTI